MAQEALNSGDLVRIDRVPESGFPIAESWNATIGGKTGTREDDDSLRCAQQGSAGRPGCLIASSSPLPCSLWIARNAAGELASETVLA
jgi:hypothetical protein